MIKKESIERTAVCYWSEEDKKYVVESTLFRRTAGIGDTPKAARTHFLTMLDEAYKYLADGKVSGYNKRGRPAKGGIGFHALICSSSKEYIGELAKELNISQGEVIDYLCAFQSATAKEYPVRKDISTKALANKFKAS